MWITGEPAARAASQQMPGRLDRPTQQADIVAERFAKPARFEKIALHVDDQQRAGCGLKVKRMRFGRIEGIVGRRASLASRLEQFLRQQRICCAISAVSGVAAPDRARLPAAQEGRPAAPGQAGARSRRRREPASPITLGAARWVLVVFRSARLAKFQQIMTGCAALCEWLSRASPGTRRKSPWSIN